MTPEKPPKIFRFLPSIAEVIFIVTLIVILNGKSNLLGDADTGYHIRAGEYIIQTLTVPHHDIFSHITPPLEWTAHEWLSEVIFAIIHSRTGLTGLVVFMAIVIASVYAILFRFIQASGASIIVATFITILAMSASTIHWLARPHAFSLLITLIWYIILDTYQYKQKNYLYLLPPIMLLWVNLHGGFIAGFLLFAIYIAGNIWRALFRKEERNVALKSLNMFVLFSFICLAVTLLNPKGYKILLFPFHLVSNTYIMDHVSEFLSPDFHEKLTYEYMLLLMIFILGISALRMNSIEILLVLIFTHMSLYSGRYIPLFAMITSPILARQIDHLLREHKNRGVIKRFFSLSERTAKTDFMTTYKLWGIATVVVLTILLFRGQLLYEFDEKKLPIAAVAFMQKEKIPGNMFNNDEFGDYIIYAAWPEYRVFFDGRSDMYGTAILKEYFKIDGIKQGWEDVLEKYNMTWVIYNTKSPLSRYLLERRDWKLIYSDKVASIFVKDIPTNRRIIEKYPDVKPVVVEEDEEDKK